MKSSVDSRDSFKGSRRFAVHVLAVEPYYGGSHRSFLDGVMQRSRHRWTLISGAARHWKWRMRNSPLSLALSLTERLATDEADADRCPDLVFYSEMLDLAQWRGFLCSLSGQDASRSPELKQVMLKICTLPAVCYFHENQWTYPTSPRAREDAHYGYSNLLTALASDETWFNSEFHRQEFLRASRDFVARMPDGKSTHDLDGLTRRSRVIPPGFDPVAQRDARDGTASWDRKAEADEKLAPIRIGWAARWEHDKRPDRFEKLLRLVEDRGILFELILLGSRPSQTPAPLQSIEQRWAGQIRFSGYAKSKSTYCRWLQEMDVVVSTADHEFFGIAICEAISAGALPVLPDALSYPELVDSTFRYRSLSEAAEMIANWAEATNRREMAQACRSRQLTFTRDKIVNDIDEGIDRVVARDDHVFVADQD